TRRSSDLDTLQVRQLPQKRFATFQDVGGLLPAPCSAGAQFGGLDLETLLDRLHTPLAHDGDGLLRGRNLGLMLCHAGGGIFDSGSAIYNFLGNTMADDIEVYDLLPPLFGEISFDLKQSEDLRLCCLGGRRRLNVIEHVLLLFSLKPLLLRFAV